MPNFTPLTQTEIDLFIWGFKAALYIAVLTGLVYIAICLKYGRTK